MSTEMAAIAHGGGAINEAPDAATHRNDVSPLLVVSKPLAGARFPVRAWRPREGRTINYIRWFEDIKFLLQALSAGKNFLSSGSQSLQCRPPHPMQLRVESPTRASEEPLGSPTVAAWASM